MIRAVLLVTFLTMLSYASSPVSWTFSDRWNRPGRYEVAPVRAASPYPVGWPQNETSPGVQVAVSASQHCADVVVPIHARAARLKVAAIDAVTQKPIPHFSLMFRNDTYPALWYPAPDAAQREMLILPGTEITVAIYAPGYQRTYSKELKPLAAGAKQELTFELDADPDQRLSRGD